LHKEINLVTNELRKYSRENNREQYELLQSIPGVGPLTSICFIAEVGEIERFQNFKNLTSLVEMMPTTYQSSDTHKTQGLTPLCLS